MVVLLSLTHHLVNVAEEHPASILNDLRREELQKEKVCPLFSSEVIRYALLLSKAAHTFAQFVSDRSFSAYFICTDQIAQMSASVIRIKLDILGLSF